MLGVQSWHSIGLNTHLLWCLEFFWFEFSLRSFQIILPNVIYCRSKNNYCEFTVQQCTADSFFAFPWGWHGPLCYGSEYKKTQTPYLFSRAFWIRKLLWNCAWKRWCSTAYNFINFIANVMSVKWHFYQQNSREVLTFKDFFFISAFLLQEWVSWMRKENFTNITYINIYMYMCISYMFTS